MMCTMKKVMVRMIIWIACDVTYKMRKRIQAQINGVDGMKMC